MLQGRNKVEIFVTGRFTALHKWGQAPEEVMFLRSLHRHEFHFKVFWEVGHSDRDLEFFIMKRKIANFVAVEFHEKDLGEKSCEMIAEIIMKKFDAARVEISEDGENGAICYSRSGESGI